MDVTLFLEVVAVRLHGVVEPGAAAAVHPSALHTRPVQLAGLRLLLDNLVVMSINVPSNSLHLSIRADATCLDEDHLDGDL